MKCYNCGKETKVTTSKRYHYTASGLDNIYISGIFVYKCKCGKTMAEIPKVEELHTFIAGKLLQKPSALIGKEIRFLRKRMGLKGVELAKQLGIDKVTVSRWENNTVPIGPANDKLLRLIFLHNYIKELVTNPEIMRRYSKLGFQIAAMHKLGQKRSRRILIPEKDLQKGAETELLLSGVS